MNFVNNPRSYTKEQLRSMFLNYKLIEAAKSGQLAVVSQLVERHKTPVNYQNCDEGTTALAAAVIGGYDNIVAYLVEHGADVNLANLRGETPLHLAVLCDNVDIISFLLGEGSWLESEDECGDTSLMFATREDKLHAVEVLLMHGADPEHPNEDGETPAMLAEEVGSEGVRFLFAMYAGRDVSNAAAAQVPDGNASGALGTSYDMKVHFPIIMTSKGIRADIVMNDVDSDSYSGAEDAALLNQSGNVHSPPLASIASSKLSRAPNTFACLDHHVDDVFMQSY